MSTDKQKKKNMNKLLFQYAVIFNPSEKQIKEENLESLILKEPVTILSNNEDEVRMRAAMEIPLEYKDKLSQIQIVVRPF